MMNNNLIKDVIEWDIVNWSRALKFWEENFDFKYASDLKCLELGGRSGGISLWLASKGCNVICSDLENPRDFAGKLHSKYRGLQIDYAAINALDIPYENEFDIIAFKSVLGGASRDGKNERKQLAIDQIYKALKPGGKLIFAENLSASSLHKYLRKRFVKWGNEWNYLDISEVNSLFSAFKNTKFKTVGFFGAFGRNENQRNILGRVDTVFDNLFGKSRHYILIGVAEK